MTRRPFPPLLFVTDDAAHVRAQPQSRLAHAFGQPRFPRGQLWHVAQPGRPDTRHNETSVSPGEETVMFGRLAVPMILFMTPVVAVAQQPPSTAVVVTSGEGVVQAVPDRAWITITAESRASNPREAQRRNAEAMSRFSKSCGCGDCCRCDPDDRLRPAAGMGLREQSTRVARLRGTQHDRGARRCNRACRRGAGDRGGVRCDRPRRHSLRSEGSREARTRGVAAGRCGCPGEGGRCSRRGRTQRGTRSCAIEEQGTLSVLRCRIRGGCEKPRLPPRRQFRRAKSRCARR